MGKQLTEADFDWGDDPESFEDEFGDISDEASTRQLTEDDFDWEEAPPEDTTTSFIPAMGRAAATIPLRVGEAAGGLVQRAGESWEKERQEIKDSIGLVQRKGAPEPRAEQPIVPLETEKGFGRFLLSAAGKAVKAAGKAVRTVRETAPMNFINEFMAKGRLAEARLDDEVSPEVQQLFKQGDSTSLSLAAKLLEDPEQFAEKSFAENVLAKPISEFGKSFSKFMRETAAKVRPETNRGSLKYYVSTAIESVGSTMAPAVVATIASKNPNVGMTIMFPQVYGQSYSEQRASGKDVTEATDTALFSAITEVASEGIPLGILTREGGKFVPRVLKGATAESIQEEVNEAVQIAYEEGIVGEDTPPEEIGRRLLEAKIIGAIGGGGLGVLSGAIIKKGDPATDDEVKQTKDAVAQGIVETYKSKEQTPEETLESVINGYAEGLFDVPTLEAMAKEMPELDIDTLVDQISKERATTGIKKILDEGLTTGKVQGHPFPQKTALTAIETAYKEQTLSKDDLTQLQKKYPNIANGIDKILEVEKPVSASRETLLDKEEAEVSAKEMLTGKKPKKAPKVKKEEKPAEPIKPELPIKPAWVDSLSDRDLSKRIRSFENTQEKIGLTDIQLQNLEALRQEETDRGIVPEKEVKDAEKVRAEVKKAGKPEKLEPGEEERIRIRHAKEADKLGAEKKKAEEVKPTGKVEPKAIPKEVEPEVPEPPKPSAIVKPPVEEKAKPVKPTELMVPSFKTTEEAVAFGKEATLEQITELKRLGKDSEAKYHALTEEGKHDEAGKEAFNVQLYHEAYDEAVKAQKEVVPEVPEVEQVAPKTVKKIAKAPEKVEAKKEEPVPKEPEVKKPEFEGVDLSKITVEVSAIRESTGETIKIKEKADVALREVDGELEKLYQILACIE